MTGRVVRVGIVVSVLLGVVAACGSSDRPRGLSMDGVKPCSLIPPAELGSLGVTAKPQSLDVVEGAGEEGASCSYTPQHSNDVYVSAVTNEGISRWANDTGDYAVTDMPRLLGYRTIKVGDKAGSDDPDATCTLYVDVASGQSLKINAGPNYGDAPPSCDTAHRFGEAAMKTLTARS